MAVGTAVYDQIQNLVAEFNANPSYELESKYTGRLTQTAFHSIRQYLLSKKYAEVSHPETLDISFQNQSKRSFRLSVSGKEAIEQYGSTNRLTPGQVASAMSKKFVEGARSVMVDAFNAKVDLRDETPLTEAELKSACISAETANKGYRYKIRTSYTDASNQFRFDCTVVRQSKDVNRRFLAHPTLAASGVMASREEYEVEIECIRRGDVGQIAQSMLGHIEDLYKAAQSSASVTAPAPAPARAPVRRSKHETITVQPNEWVLPNRTGFGAWVPTAFPRDAYERAREAVAEGALAETPTEPSGQAPGTTPALSLFPHQRLVQDLYQIQSPYRGVLLYHGLGSGKSCSSIAAAETFLTAGRRIYVLVPASLETNYRTEIGRCSSIGNPEVKLWKQLKIAKTRTAKIYAELTERLEAAHGLREKFVATMARENDHRLWIPAATPGIPAKFVVPEREAVAWSDLTDRDRTAVRALIAEMTNTKVKFIHYNGVTQKGLDALGARPFDDAFVVIDEAHNYISRVVNGGKIARRLFRMLMDATNARLVLLTGTPIINHPYESATLLNLVRGPIHVETFSLLKAGAGAGAGAAELPDEAAVREALAPDLAGFVDTVRIHPETRTIAITLVPEGFMRVAGAAVAPASWPVAGRRAMLDSIHVALSKRFKIGKRTQSSESYAFPSSREEFGELFLDETTDPDAPRVKNRDLFLRRALGCVSYLKTVNEAFLPQELPRVRVTVPMSDYQFSRYTKVRDIERRMESSRARAGAGAAGGGGLMGAKTTVYRAFSRMALNYVFPEAIERPFPKDVRRQMLEKELSAAEDDAEVAAVAEAEAGAAEAGVAAAAEKAAAQKRKYDEQLAAAIAALRDGADQYLTPAALETYSPKFGRMLKYIQESPGSVLVYSQFRTVEGLGIFGMVLEAAGFVQLKIRPVAGGAGGANDWEIEDAERVLSPAYDGRRYAVFTDDRERTRRILQIFNSQWDQLPASLAAPLRAAYPRANLYGDLCRVFMISQSATEGITTLNVRRVLITEPYWNSLRIQQVIGRAIRAYSHMALPPADRTVQVFQFEMALTPAQLKSSFTIQRQDGGLTSDQHIRDVAGRKDDILRQFLDMLKSAAVDCILRAPENRIGEQTPGLTCYAFPYPLDAPDATAEAYVPSLTEDAATAPTRRWAPDQMEQRRTVRGRVVVLPSGKKAVQVPGRDGLHDYDAYKYAGVLLRIPEALLH